MMLKSAGREKVQKTRFLKTQFYTTFGPNFILTGAKSIVSVYTFSGTKIWTNFINQIFKKLQHKVRRNFSFHTWK